MKKMLFIDRDGTIIKEPTDNFQVDRPEKLEFMPSDRSTAGDYQEYGFSIGDGE